MKFKNEIDTKIYSILIKEWDPIGIGNDPDAQNEYFAYLPHVKHILLHKSDSELAKYLAYAEVDLIGLSEANLENIQRVITLLKNCLPK